MPDAKELRAAVEDCLIRYGGDPFPDLIARAEGACVWDSDGRRILDFTSGQMCATVGHNHPAIVAAIERSARTAIHLFSGMIPEVVAELARRMAEILPSPLKRSLFLNTGGESNEAAIKICLLYTSPSPRDRTRARMPSSA